MNVLQTSLGEIELQPLAVELRRMPRAGDGSNIGEAIDVKTPEETQKVFQAVGRMTDGEELSTGCFHSPGSSRSRVARRLLQATG